MSRLLSEPVKSGPLIHYCCRCGEPFAGHGLGPPARPDLVWFCSEHAPEHLMRGRADPEGTSAPAARTPTPQGDLFGRAA